MQKSLLDLEVKNSLDSNLLTQESPSKVEDEVKNEEH